MAEIPKNEVSQGDLIAWYDLAKKLRNIKAQESLLRKKIFNGAFPDPSEGTNNFPLADEYVLKGKHTINRDIDQGAFSALKDKLRELEINPDDLVQYKPALVLKQYRKLNDEQTKLFDQCLIVKPGSPSLEIVLPAKAKKKKVS